MTGLQELRDEIVVLETKLLGKRLELAMAQGERELVRQQINRMHEVILERRKSRIDMAGKAECHFDAAGEADRASLIEAKKDGA